MHYILLICSLDLAYFVCVKFQFVCTMKANTLWRDITVTCRESVKLMTDTDPMISSSDFSLYDYMSAVELMDPKMDQCCGISGPVNTNALLQYKCDSELPSTTLISLFQSLVVNEVAFLDGSSLMETVHQCRFLWADTWTKLEQSNNQSEKYILAFCKSLSKSLGCTFTALLAADIFEEEDFQATNRSHLNEEIDDIQLDELMTHAMKVLESSEPSSTDSSPEKYLLLQLRCRHSLHALQSRLASWIHTTVAKHSRQMKARQRRQEGRSREEDEVEDSSGANEVSEACNQIKTLAKSALSAVKRLQIYHGEYIASQVAEAESTALVGDLTTHSESSSLDFAFNPALVRMVLVSPVRYVKLRKFSESLAYLGKMCEEVINVAVTTGQLLATSSTLTFDELLGVSQSLSESRTHVLARSFYLAVIYTFTPSLNLLLQRSMMWYALPNSVVQCELVSDQWLPENPTSAAWETLKLLCCNRNVMPIRMDQVLSLWGAVSNDAVFVDERFRLDNEIPDAQQWCSSWALVQTATVMDLHMGLLMESDVLGVQELDYFFWYWDYICTTKSFAIGKLRDQRYTLDVAVHASATEKLSKSVVDVSAPTSKSDKSAKKKTKAKPVSSVAAAPSSLPSLPVPEKRPISVDEMMVAGRSQLSRALFRMAIVTGVVGVVDKAENRFMSWDRRFQLRFRAFQGITNPPMLSHADFHRTVHSRGSEQPQPGVEAPIDVHPVLTGAGVCFQNARKYFDEVRKMPQMHLADLHAQNKALVLTKVSVASSLGVMKATKLIPKIQKEQRLSKGHRLTVNQTYDKHHPVLEVSLLNN